jgi:hypothetical protein
MAKRGRPRIHPPKVPKGESAKTTIALQDKQIKMLIERCQFLEQQRETAVLAYEKMTKIPQIELAHARLQGWQDCMRELINRDRITVTGE